MLWLVAPTRDEPVRKDRIQPSHVLLFPRRTGSPTGRFCSSCGGSLEPNTAATIDSNELSADQETIAPPSTPASRRPSSAPTPSRPQRTPSSGGSRSPSSDPISGGRFTPGEIIAERLLRKTWLAILVVAAIGTSLSMSNTGEHPVFGAVALVVLYVSFLLVLKLHGLLPLVVGLAVQNVLLIFPATVHLSRWYAAPSLAGLSAIALVAIYALRTALAGQTLFSVESFDR